MVKRKFTKIMLWLFFAPLAIDWILTIIGFIKEGHTLSETNPLFIAVHRNLYIFAILMIGIAMFWYYLINLVPKKNAAQYHFYLISLIVLTLIARIFAVYSNILHIFNPVPVKIAESAALYGTASQITWYSTMVGVIIFIPFICIIVIFNLYKIGYEIKQKE